MAHDVFISYSSQDKPVADAACASLEARKIRCWIAPRDVLPGVPYGEALIEALHQSRVLVLVFSANSNQSPQVMREVERAVSQGIPILPLRIENVMPSKALEYFVSSSHWLDALTPPLERHLQKLADAVEVLLATQKMTSPGAEVISAKLASGTTSSKKNKRLPILIGGSIVLVVAVAAVIFIVGGFGRQPANLAPPLSPPTASPALTSSSPLTTTPTSTTTAVPVFTPIPSQTSTSIITKTPTAPPSPPASSMADASGDMFDSTGARIAGKPFLDIVGSALSFSNNQYVASIKLNSTPPAKNEGVGAIEWNILIDLDSNLNTGWKWPLVCNDIGPDYYIYASLMNSGYSAGAQNIATQARSGINHKVTPDTIELFFPAQVIGQATTFNYVMATRQYAKAGDANTLVEADKSPNEGHFTFPATIAVDGVLNDWPSTASSFSDPPGDVSNEAKDQRGVDLKSIRALMDETFLYIALQVYDIFEPSLLRNYFLAVDLDNNGLDEYEFGVRPNGSTWVFDHTKDKNNWNPVTALGFSAVGKQDTIEMKIPRKEYQIPAKILVRGRVSEGGPTVDITDWFRVP